MKKPHWTDPGVYEIVPGVYRIPLPLEGDALGAINVYAVVHGEPMRSRLALIDSGWGGRESTRNALAEALSNIGFVMSNIDQLFITHLHSDHYTFALDIRRDFGSIINLGEDEEPNISEAMFGERSRRGLDKRIRLSGVPNGLYENLHTARPHSTNWEEPDRWLHNGAEYELDGKFGPKLQVIPTPGHTRGHVSYYDSEQSLMFCGDHVLPEITPSVGYEPMPLDSPLATYMASLASLRTMPDAQLLPGHGPVKHSVHARIDELLSHHETRLHESLLAVKGASSAYEVAKDLAWTRHKRKFDELNSFNQMLAVNETYAHLQVLNERGEVTLIETDSHALFEKVQR